MNLFGVGPLELVVILLVALIFVGPERLPRLAADLARTIREIRKYTGSLAAEFQEVVKDVEKQTDAERGIWKDVSEGIGGATRQVTEAVRTVRQDVNTALAEPKPAANGAQSAGDNARTLTRTDRSSDLSSAPSSDLSPAPSSDPSSAPSSGLSPAPPSDLSPASSSDLSPAPSSDLSPAPSSDLSSAPSSGLSSAPSSDLSSAPSSDLSAAVPANGATNGASAPTTGWVEIADPEGDAPPASPPQTATPSGPTP